jgi:hypothetical protein
VEIQESIFDNVIAQTFAACRKLLAFDVFVAATMLTLV